MVWKKVVNADAGDADHFGGNDTDKISDLFSGVDIDTVDINSDFKFRSGRHKQSNPANTFKYTTIGSAIAADRDVTEPLLTGNDTRVYEAHTQTLTNKTIDYKTNTVKLLTAYKYVVYQDGSNTVCFDNDTGAVVSTNTDDDVPIQYAVDNAAGKPILIKAGTYTCNTEINCVDKYVYIVGEGSLKNSNPTKISKAGAGNIINCDNTSSLYNSVRLENLLIDGVDKLGVGLRTDQIKHCFDLVRNVKIVNCLTGWHFTNGWYNNMWELWIEDCATGLWLENNSQAATMQDGANTLYFYGGKIQGCTTYNLYADVVNEDVAFYGTVFENDETHDNTYTVRIDSEAELVRFYDCSFENFNADAIIIHDAGKNTRITNCRFQNNDTGENYTAYEAVGARSAVLMGNQFGASTTGTINITIDSGSSNCALYYNQRRRWIVPLAITLTNNSTTTTLIGNSFTDDRFDNRVAFANALIKSGVISPSQITSDQNDYNPTGFSNSNIVRLDSDSSFRTITGIVPTANQEVKLENISANTILLKNQSTGSSAANRFEFGGYDVPIFPGSQITLNYDNTTTRWRIDSPLKHIIPPIGMGFHYMHDCFGSGSDAFTSTTAASGGSITAVGSVAGHPGVINFTSGTSATGNGIIRTTSNAAIFLIANNWYYRFDAIVRLSVVSDGTNTYELFIGFADQWSAEPVDGVYFRYTHSVNSGKWELVARSNNTETVTNATNSAVAAATWYHLTVIVNPAGNVAEFFQDGVSLGTVTTNIPTGAGRGTSSGAGFLKSAGTSDTAFLDVDAISGIAYSNVTR